MKNITIIRKFIRLKEKVRKNIIITLKKFPYLNATVYRLGGGDAREPFQNCGLDFGQHRKNPSLFFVAAHIGKSAPDCLQYGRYGNYWAICGKQRLVSSFLRRGYHKSDNNLVHGFYFRRTDFGFTAGWLWGYQKPVQTGGNDLQLLCHNCGLYFHSGHCGDRFSAGFAQCTGGGICAGAGIQRLLPGCDDFRIWL